MGTGSSKGGGYDLHPGWYAPPTVGTRFPKRCDPSPRMSVLLAKHVGIPVQAWVLFGQRWVLFRQP